jgi:hypothetical protein
MIKKTTFRVEYDDRPEDIIGKFKEALNKLSICPDVKVQNDNEEHNGFEIYEVEII